MNKYLLGIFYAICVVIYKYSVSDELWFPIALGFYYILIKENR